MEHEHLPAACQIVKNLELSALEVFSRQVIKQSFPVIEMNEEDSFELCEQLAAEVGRMWESIDPDQIAYIIKSSSENEWDDPDICDSFFGLSVEEIVLDCVYVLLQDDIENVLDECLGPGESCRYNFLIRTYDEEVVQGMIQEVISEGSSFQAFNEDEDDDDADSESSYKDFSYEIEEGEDFEEVEISRMLTDSIWREHYLIKDFVVEVRGERAAIYKDDNGQERLVIPRVLDLLAKTRKARPGLWCKHMLGWEFRLVKKNKKQQKQRDNASSNG
jgi:hypothetical protein